jgi:hypothetical protein
MKKLLMWAVGVPFLVLSMVMVTFDDGSQHSWTEAANGQVMQRR